MSETKRTIIFCIINKRNVDKFLHAVTLLYAVEQFVIVEVTLVFMFTFLILSVLNYAPIST